MALSLIAKNIDQNNTWKAINNALQGPQAIWLIGVGDRNQTILQFVLEDDAVDWQFRKEIISEERKQESLESLKVVDLAEQTSMLAYAHINLLEMLQRFNPNKVIENISAFFKQVEVKSDPNLCSYYLSCTMCSDLVKFFISKLEYAKWIKNGASAKTHRSDSYALLHQPEEQKIREIQPGQWCDKGKKIYGPNLNIIYWPIGMLMEASG
ncbi:16347_t:CDS:2 [Cetraspora pellucida]|uniref:16347_t:CDS:1 n=1 Tax=Cetraspora pellucida TaxID=1433469 RepID=A0A9N9HL28_9GLOM|nr:16347_t:CDS:2 [Cetraspora pellucida]